MPTPFDRISGPLDRLRERYENDTVFHQVVTMLEGAILQAKLTPSEVRDAAMLACMRIEERRMPLYIVSVDEIRRATDEEEEAYRRQRGGQ